MDHPATASRSRIFFADPTLETRETRFGLFNWSDSAREFELDPVSFGFLGAAPAPFEFWEKKKPEIRQGRIVVKVPPRDCRVVALGKRSKGT